jgi:PHD/YefM family antitoxin component YafN of YafNO toxin-antitoxin module
MLPISEVKDHLNEPVDWVSQKHEQFAIPKNVNLVAILIEIDEWKRCRRRCYG